ncbi:MAG: 5-methyltetrahydrofolate--homocysteine methyltransferase [bacterium]|nr:MAG: 5-methyltetrahydrofolate--homocysteine methyltransferase [bacterium]
MTIDIPHRSRTTGHPGRPVSDAENALRAIMARRIAIIDGAMGTMLQRYRLEEPDYRGERFKDHPRDLRNNADVLNLVRPDLVEKVYREYLEAGADIIETNTFSATAISQADYGLEALAYEMNVEAARIARRAVEGFVTPESGPRFVAGSLGPTNRTASLAVDVNHPGKRTHSFEDFRAAYYDQARGLVDGGVDFLLVETVFDTLVGKAALFAIQQLFDEGGRRVPIMLSVTIVDQSGRNLSGQTVEAFWNSVSHVPLFSVGINCSERRPSEPAGRHRLRRDARDHGAAPRCVGPGGVPEHGRRLLWHDAGPYPGHRGGRGGGQAARDPADPVHASPVGP